MSHATLRLGLLLLMALAACPAQAQTQVTVTPQKKPAPAAPTQPVTSQNLPAPAFQSDVKNLEAILDKDEEARVIEGGGKAEAAPAHAVSGHVSQAELEAAAQEEAGLLSTVLMTLRVGAIRWRDAIEIVFAAVISLYVRKLYLLSREQHKILSHAIRSAEYAAAAAKRSADICETLMQEHKKPDENQGKLDI